MPNANAVKYSTTTQTGALQKGKVAVGVSGSFGPTNTTSWWNGIVPQDGKYIVYETSAGYAPRIYAPQNSDELKRLALQFGATSGDVSSETAILQWFATQTNYYITNINYPSIVTNGLQCNLDVTTVGSYPNSGTNWFDLSGNGINASLYSGTPVFSNFDGKRSIQFRNQNKVVYAGNHDGFILNANPNISASNTSFTLESWFYQTSADQGGTVILSTAGGCGGFRWGPNGSYTYWLLGNDSCSQYSEGTLGVSSNMIGRWVHMVGVFDRANTLGGGPALYNFVNGELESSTGTYNPTMPLNAPGIAYCCGAFDGYISVIRVYNRALTPSEVTQNFNAQRDYFGV
jgi:hypothetical protein